MKIDENLVEYIAHLSRLNLTDEEKKVFIPQLIDIINYVEKLNQLEVDGVPPMDHVLDIKNVYRQDITEASFSCSEILKNAPKVNGRFFEVPKII